ncbi:MFS transporter [Actinokineospora xionganensis]|uniref:MFS transporter n=1 Tax=Actinokineospora xionganensis TaxID=2684470 RepID=UPI0028AADF4E|nr:MFS transporter [Actinokineospora xionganensis]
MRGLVRVSLWWAALTYLVPIYPLYAVFFADTGLSGAEISLLFLIWSSVSVLAEVPLGAVADRFSRRSSLVGASLLQALGYVLWIGLPGFTGFAVGFVLWGLGGALESGAFEALLYDGLAGQGEESAFALVNGRVTAVNLLTELPTAVLASGLFALGGYRLAAWVSVGVCLAAAWVASRFPEAARGADDGELGYVELLKVGLREAADNRVVRHALIVVALLGGLDAFEEYFPLMALAWGVPAGWVPLAMVGIPLAGAVGAALGGFGSGLRTRTLGVLLGVAVAVLVVSGVLRSPAGLLAVAGFYGLYQLVLVVAEARLQDSIEGPARATVTSVAGIGIEVSALAVYGVWALGEVFGVAALVALVALLLPRWLRQAPVVERLPR